MIWTEKLPLVPDPYHTSASEVAYIFAMEVHVNHQLQHTEEGSTLSQLLHQLGLMGPELHPLEPGSKTLRVVMDVEPQSLEQFKIDETRSPQLIAAMIRRWAMSRSGKSRSGKTGILRGQWMVMFGL